MKNAVWLLLCVALGGFAVARATEEKASGQMADAKTLLHDAKKATAAIIKNARADKDLDPTTARNKPFWQSIQLVAKNLRAAESGLAVKNNDFFKRIADARKAEEQMTVAWQLTDSKNKAVILNGKKLGHALTILRTDFSKEAERKKKGGELTGNEKAQFNKIKGQQKELIAQIRKLESEAKKDKALEKGLAEIKKQAEHIAKQSATLDAFIGTLYLLDVQAGLIRGYEYYVDRDRRKDYLVLVDYTKAYENWYSEWKTSADYDWAVVNIPVDIGEDVDVSSEISEQEIDSEESYAESRSFAMSEAERDGVAAEEDTTEIAAAQDESIEEASNDEGVEMSDDATDDDDGGG
jgi:hypothetical protein